MAGIVWDWNDLRPATDQPDRTDHEIHELECAIRDYNPPPYQFTLTSTVDDVADWIAEHFWLEALKDYANMGPDIVPDPEREAMHEIEHAARILHPWIIDVLRESV